jgi:hypothetical protein
MFANFHNEIASHGFMIVANGPIKGGVTGFTTDKELTKAIDWVHSLGIFFKLAPNLYMTGYVKSGGEAMGRYRYEQACCRRTILWWRGSSKKSIMTETIGAQG